MSVASRQPLTRPTSARIAGVDEVGRGPLAGPVVAAAVMLPQEFDLDGVADSKTLGLTQRESAEARIRAEAVWSIAFVDHMEIDRTDILQATMLAMRQAIQGLPIEPSEAAIDGDRVPDGLHCPAQAIVKGDSRHACIAAASILAKCARDRFMVQMACRYPVYGFERHMGYASPEHLAAIAEHGPCEIHRLSFSPFRKEAQLCLMLDD